MPNCGPRLQQRLAALSLFASLAAAVGCGDSPRAQAPSPVRIEVTLSEALAAEQSALEGRMILILSKNDDSEPRFQVAAGMQAPAVFGIDIHEFGGDSKATFDADVFGFPATSLADLAADRYWVQAVLHRYDSFDLATGHTVQLHMDRGEGHNWRTAPGNLYSTAEWIELDPDSGTPLTLELSSAIPPIEPPEDTKYVRHVRMRSELLSEFWGRDMELGAHVLVPEGFDDHPEARYPLMVFHGHFPSDFGGFRTEPPEEDLECEYSDRFHVDCYNRIQQEEAYAQYQQWIAADFPRFLVIEIQHPTPYYDDSYAVNSASQGPWGDAINHELIPFIEEQFRGIGEGWARFTYGGSTGGWEAMATQIFYPDMFNGAFVACPDPIDFRAFTLIDIYRHENAYYEIGPFKKLERPGHRNWLGEVDSTVREQNHLELALGTHGRSGDQWDIWQATYSPQGADGYPAPIWNKLTGEIDREVAEYWRENFDLRYILERDWSTLGPKVAGKLHIYCGDMDNYYLNNAVYLTEEFLESTAEPYYDGLVDYGDRAEHCWNGDHENGNHISRLRYNTMYLPLILERIETSAPRGADLTSWRY